MYIPGQGDPGLVEGAGRVLTPDDVRVARDAGARFCSALGSTGRLLRCFVGIAMPFLPAAVTVSEIMRLMERGYRTQKIYPAGAAGGLETLSALSGSRPHLRFCAAGTINSDNANNFIALPKVINVSGNWLLPPAAPARGDWTSITGTARKITRR